MSIISSDNFIKSDKSFQSLMKFKKRQIGDKMYKHNMLSKLIDGAKNEKSEELKKFANQILIDEFKYDISKEKDNKYIFNIDNYNKKTSKFGRLCYSILYILIKKAIMQTRGVLIRLDKNPNAYMKLNTGIKLNNYINYYKNDNEGNKIKVISAFKFHEFLYGKQMSNNFKDRDNTPEFWKSHWEFDFSPFRVAQNILKEFNIYLVDHTLYGDNLHCFMYYQLPEKTYNYWHQNNNIPNINSSDTSYVYNSKKINNIVFYRDNESNKMLEYYEMIAHLYNYYHLENESKFSIF